MLSLIVIESWSFVDCIYEQSLIVGEKQMQYFEHLLKNGEGTMTFLSLVASILGIIIAILIFMKQNKIEFEKDCNCILSIIDEMKDVSARMNDSCKIVKEIKLLHQQIVSEDNEYMIYQIFSEAKSKLSEFRTNEIHYPIPSYDKYETRLIENKKARIKYSHERKRISISDLSEKIKRAHKEVGQVTAVQDKILQLVPNGSVVEQALDKKPHLKVDEIKMVFSSTFALLDEYYNAALNAKEKIAQLL